MADRTFRVEKNREDAIRVLQIVIDTLKAHNIEYYLDFGTLIGAIRDKGLIPWDDDIDISLLNEEDYSKIPQVLKEIKRKHRLRTYLFTFEASTKKLKARGKKIYQESINFTSNTNYQVAKVRTNNYFIFGRGNTCIDIFFKYTHKDNIFWMAYGQVNSVPTSCFNDELVEIDFCGIKCTIPKEYNEYLAYKYGDWMTPKENWTHTDDDFSINS
jgi:phosphorylcholine metabolism protein LicD